MARSSRLPPEGQAASDRASLAFCSAADLAADDARFLALSRRERDGGQGGGASVDEVVEIVHDHTGSRAGKETPAKTPRV